MFIRSSISSLAGPLIGPAYFRRLLSSIGVQLHVQKQPTINHNFRIESDHTTTTAPKLSRRQARKRRQLLLKMQIYPATGDSVSPFMREKYEREARKYWDLFYKRNENRFFKDRHYLQKEWGHLLGPSHASATVASATENRRVKANPVEDNPVEAHPSDETAECNNADSASLYKNLNGLENENYMVDTSTASDKQVAAFDKPVTASDKRVVLEVGCGAGNTVYPLLEENPTAFVYACDFSPRAVDLVKAHPSYNAQRVHAFVADITKDDLTKEVPAESVDIVSMIFVLSAISPEKMPAALRNVASVLKPGGHVLVRDYAEGDLAQERLTGKIQKLGENFYVRGDGTRAYYFSERALLALFADAGLECTDVRMHEREFENRARKVVMNRRWIQGTFRKATGAVGSAASPSEPSIDGLSQQLAGSTMKDAEDSEKETGVNALEVIENVNGNVVSVAVVRNLEGGPGVNTLGLCGEKNVVNPLVECLERNGVNAPENIEKADGVNAPENFGKGDGVKAPMEKGEEDGVKAPKEDGGINGVNALSGDGVNALGEDGLPSLGELFSAPLEYELRELVVAGKTVRYRALASENQHTQPSTGLLLWESARVLAAYLSDCPHILADRRVLEVGCGGIALPSILFAAATAGVTATDGDAAAMSLLRANVALNSDATDLNKLRTERLRWGDQDDIARVRRLGGPRGYDVIIGADVVYVKEAVPLLFQTAAALLADECDAAPDAADVMLTPPLLLLCHVTRRVAEGDILEAAGRAGFEHHAVIELGGLGEGANGAIRLLALRRTNGAV